MENVDYEKLGEMLDAVIFAADEGDEEALRFCDLTLHKIKSTGLFDEMEVVLASDETP